MAASFLTIVSLIQRDTVTVNSELVSAFSADLLTFLSSNNPTALQSGILALNKTQFGKRVKDVLTACKLPATGFAGGALTGTKWKDQPESVTAPILAIHSGLVADFQTRLENAGLFDKKEQSQEQKDTAKANRDKKAADAINSAIAARGLVDPSTIQELGVNAQLDNVMALLNSGVLDLSQVQAVLAASVAALNDPAICKTHAKYVNSLIVAAAPAEPAAFKAVADITVS